MKENLASDFIEMVERFTREVIDLPIPSEPTPLTNLRIDYAVDHLEEELFEFKEAAYKRDLEGSVDALIDLVYVALGRLVEMGVAPRPVFEEVHAANMRKHKGVVAKRGSSGGFDAIKPEGWTAPKLSKYLTITAVDMDQLLASLDKLENSKDKDIEDDGFITVQPRPRTTKKTAGKPPLSRIPIEALNLEAQIFEFGANKYTWNGFKESPPSVHELLSALIRHAYQFASGQDLDLGPNGEGPPDYSGQSHIGHMRCCTSMLAWVMKNRPDRDDR